MTETALVLPGGGSRTFYLSGVLNGAGLYPEDVTAIYALSTAAPIAAYFATGQIGETGPAWIEALIASKFLSWWRLLRFQRPGDAHAFIHQGCASLDVRLLPADKLFVSTLRLYDGATVCHAATSENVRDLLVATCSFPIVTTPHELNGEPHMDGGAEETFPVLTAYQRGARRIIAIANRPASYQMKPYGMFARLLTFPRWPGARAALGRRATRLAETRAFLDDPPRNTRVLLIQPEADLPAGRLTLDPKPIYETYARGLEMGTRYSEVIQNFLR
jgi:predicted patatin/cPLA2 family phospholipase